MTDFPRPLDLTLISDAPSLMPAALFTIRASAPSSGGPTSATDSLVQTLSVPPGFLVPQALLAAYPDAQVSCTFRENRTRMCGTMHHGGQRFEFVMEYHWPCGSAKHP